MTDQSYQLLRIIIIDSFWKGQVNELDISGHTQLEGTNGAGKTSLMRLVPLFYGMRPSEIVSKVDQASNFADFYLPRESSLLVYEFKRPYSQTCMMLAKSDGRGVHFKFIDGAYFSERFIAESGIPFPINDIERHYRNDNCHCSAYLGVDKYRQVIQNLREGRKFKDVRELQRQYSFSDLPMPHIDKVINGTIEKNLDFDAVKRMLVAISSDKLARKGIAEKEHSSLNKEEITRWLADIQASRAIQEKSQQISLWQTDFNKLDSLIVKLQHLHAEAQTHELQLSEQQEKRESDKAFARKKRSELIDELDKTTRSLQDQINAINVKVGANQSQIDSLEDRKFNYDDQDASLFQIQADQAPKIQQELNDVNEIIAAFEGNIARVKTKFEKLIQDIKLQKVTDIAENKDKISTLKESAYHQLNKVNETNQSQKVALNVQLNENRLSFKLQLQNIANELDKCLVQQKNPTLPEALLSSIEENSRLLQETQETQNIFLQNVTTQNKTLSLLEKQRAQLLEKRTQENRYLDKLKQQCIDIESQLLPINGSLHQFLDHCEEANGWKDNIGRILSTEQLNRTDLAPTWQGKINNLYGLQIEIDQLENSDLQLSESELREKATVLEDKRVAQKVSIESIDAQLAVLNKDVTAQQTEIGTFQQQLTQNELKLSQLKVQKESLSDKKTRAIHDANIEVEAKIKRLDSDDKSQQKKLVEFENEAQEQQSELTNSLFEQRMVIESDRDNQLEKLASIVADIELSVKTRLTDYRSQKNKALDDLDPDGEVDKRSKEQRKLEKDLGECAVWANKAKEYRVFMEDSYIHLAPLIEETLNKNIELVGFKNNLADFTHSKQQEIDFESKTLKKLAVQLLQNEDLLTQLKGMKTECENQGIVKVLCDNEPNNDADLTITFCRDWLSEFSFIHKKLFKQIQDFNDLFSKKHARSELYENWEKLIADNDKFNGAKNIFKFQKPIQDLLSSAIQKQKNTYQLVTVNANIINEFYQHIEHFGRTISQIGKQLSKSVTALASFEALADINVYTVMKQEELEYWGPLQQFSKLFEKYRDDLREGLGDIPEELVYAMQKLSAYLPNDGFVLAHESLFDIEFTITEKGHLKRARNARQLKKISSTGLSYLAMLSLFSGLLGMLRGQEGNHSTIILPVDELGELAAENIDLLLKMFTENSISMLSASPSTDRHILSLYDRHYKLKDNKIYHAKIPTSRLDELLAMRNKLPTSEKGAIENV